MAVMFATGKLSAQALSLPAANDVWIETGHNDCMVKPRSPAKKSRPDNTIEAGDTLFLREWLNALDLRQGRIAEAADVNTGYVSQLVNREKYPDEEPKVSLVRRLARAMEVPWHLLYELPPADPLPISEMHRYPPDLLRRISTAKARKKA